MNFAKFLRTPFSIEHLQWLLLETKAIQTNLDTFSHNLIYPGIIQVYLEPCVTITYLRLWYIQNPDIFSTRSIFRTPAYSQPWYIQNPAIFRTLAYSKSEAHTESCHISTLKLTNYNYFRKACRVEINILW